MDFLAGMNPQQAEAVRHLDGPLLILAGAGSGKTRVITHRIAHMVCERGVPAWAILAVTFTNKAAGEMRDRVKKLLEGKVTGQGPTVATFHSFCVRMLRKYGDRLSDIRPGFTRNFTIYDDDDQVSIVKSIFKNLGVDDKSLPPRSALSMISNAKSAKVSSDEMKAKATDPIAAKVAVVYEQYEARLRTANALDFDDLLLESVRLLQYDTNTRVILNERIHYLMIDEYQDTNRSQYELMRLLSGSRRNVAVVGDEDQSIYSWRGADIRNILDFEKDFPNATVIRLEQNYRSTKNILEAAGAVVANNTARKGKKLWTAGVTGEFLSLYEAISSENEALFIAETTDRTLRDHPDWRVAILYRTNSQSRQIEEALRRVGRKYIVVGGFSFYQRAEIKDLLAYLRLLLTPTDNVGLYRIINTPARGIGKSSIDALDAHASAKKISAWEAIEQLLEARTLGARADTALDAFRSLILDLRNIADKPVDDILEAVIEKTGYMRMLEKDRTEEAENRIANVNELVNAAADAAERGESLAEFLDQAALVSDADSVDEKAQVSMLTIHNAKGLEFPVVFLAGMEEGLFPHQRSFDSVAMLEEERRLCYVGMTRAEKKLYLSWARMRRRWGGAPPEPSISSRFLKEVPPPLVKKSGLGVNFAPEVELYSEQYEVRNTVRKNLYTGKTYNSVENVAQFFKDRGATVDPRYTANQQQHQQQPALPLKPAVAPVTPTGPRPGAMAGAKPALKKSRLVSGGTVNHPTLGRGTIVRVEGEGPEAKITVSFPGHGLKKIIAKYAGITE